MGRVNAWSFGQGLHNVLGLGQLAGGLLGMPAQVQGQTHQAEAIRALLPQLMPGITPEQAQAVAPTPGLQFLNPDQGGTLGKILGGVGDVGTIMQTLTGGQGTNAPPISLEVLASLTGRNLDREKFAYQQQHDVEQMDQEKRRTSATERQADAAMKRAEATAGGGPDKVGLREAADRSRRLTMLDTLGPMSEPEKAAWLERGAVPKTAPNLALGDFLKMFQNAKTPESGGMDPYTPAAAHREAVKEYGRYSRELRKAQRKGVRTPQPGTPGALGAQPVDLTSLSPAASIAMQRLKQRIDANQITQDAARIEAAAIIAQDRKAPGPGTAAAR